MDPKWTRPRIMGIQRTRKKNSAPWGNGRHLSRSEGPTHGEQRSSGGVKQRPGCTSHTTQTLPLYKMLSTGSPSRHAHIVFDRPPYGDTGCKCPSCTLIQFPVLTTTTRSRQLPLLPPLHRYGEIQGLLGDGTLPPLCGKLKKQRALPKITAHLYLFEGIQDSITPDEYRSIVEMGITKTPLSAGGPGGRSLNPMDYFAPNHNSHCTSLAAYLIEGPESEGVGNEQHPIRVLLPVLRNASSRWVLSGPKETQAAAGAPTLSRLGGVAELDCNISEPDCVCKRSQIHDCLRCGILPTLATLFFRNMPREFTTLSDLYDSGPDSQRER